MKKPMLLNILSIILVILGLVVTMYAMRSIFIYFKGTALGQYGAMIKNYRIFSIISFLMGMGILVSGVLLFLGKEIGRKIYLVTIVLSLVFRIFSYGIEEMQAFGIPVLILVFLYQYWGIKNYFIEKKKQIKIDVD